MACVIEEEPESMAPTKRLIEFTARAVSSFLVSQVELEAMSVGSVLDLVDKDALNPA